MQMHRVVYNESSANGAILKAAFGFVSVFVVSWCVPVEVHPVWHHTAEEPQNTSVRCGSEKARILKGSVTAEQVGKHRCSTYNDSWTRNFTFQSYSPHFT